MDRQAKASDGCRRTEIQIRVRYTECDPMNMAHHSAYPVWLEIARAQWLRDAGAPHRDLEKRGVLFVVARLAVRYKKPAMYDDIVRVSVWEDATNNRIPFKLDHRYEILRGPERLATAYTTLVCVDGQHRPQAVPESLLARPPGGDIDGAG